MRDWSINIAPFEFVSLLKCDIHKTVNGHATATIVGHIPEHLEDKYVEMSLRPMRSIITARNDIGEEKILFNGIVTDLIVDTNNEMKRLTIELVSSSFLMDNHPFSRTFQNASMTYDGILNFLSESYENYGFVMTVGSGASIGDIIVQYKETDWEFLKRVVSRHNSVLVPSYTLDGIMYSFGLPKRSTAIEINPDRYSMHKAAGEYIYKTENGVDGITESDAIYYRVIERDIYDIADKIIFRGRELYVFYIRTELIGSELYHTYTLKTKEGFKSRHYHNEGMIGGSWEGSVIDVMQDVVKVHVHVDKEQDVGTAKWFAYSTVYSTPDGTGWYAMPEIGDLVRLYLPNEKEEDGYVVSAVHLAQGSDLRTNPDYKSLRNKHGKEVLFKPDSLTFTNNKGMYVEIRDEEGINIVSDKKINIVSDESVTIASAQADISVIAPDGILFEQSDTRVTMKDDVIMSGAQVVAQE